MYHYMQSFSIYACSATVQGVRAFDCRSRGPWFEPGCPLMFCNVYVSCFCTPVLYYKL